MRDAYDFTIGLRGLDPGPHRIWLANPESLKMNRLLSSD
jgi:4-carboxymuconolactone decarboxylase